jgi:hypothetical protein
MNPLRGILHRGKPKHADIPGLIPGERPLTREEVDSIGSQCRASPAMSVLEADRIVRDAEAQLGIS